MLTSWEHENIVQRVIKRMQFINAEKPMVLAVNNDVAIRGDVGRGNRNNSSNFSFCGA